MRRLHTIIAIVMFACLPKSAGADSSDVFIPIAKYMASGDAESLSAWFAPSLEITLLNAMPSDCSCAQATQIMKTFFKRYKPVDFTVGHQAGKENLKYAIAQMKTSEEAFIVTIFVFYTPDKGYQIQQLRIERAE